ncbi:hypothetical protein EV121DRAFT_291181 [Schizophyllum commune]
MAAVNLPSSQKFDFSDVAPWIGASAPSLRQRYVPDLPEELWESDMNGRDAIAPYANDVREAFASIERDRKAMRVHREQVISLLRGMDALDAGLAGVACRLRSCMAPVHQLPSELLALVFRFCVGGEAIPLRYDASPGVLTHVCRRWRSIAREAPALWSHINATGNRLLGNPHFSAYQFSKGAPHILSSFLHLSQGHPLTLHCLAHDSPELAGSVCNTFLAASHRVRDLSIVSSGTQSSWLERDGYENEFSMLHHLDLSDFTSLALAHTRLIFPAPALRSIALPPLVASMPSKELLQALKHVTTYRGPIVVDFSFNVLRDMPGLENCTITLEGNGYQSVLHNKPPALLNNLRTLQLDACDDGVFEVGQFISTPRLETLRILQPTLRCRQVQQFITDVACHSTLTSLGVAVFTHSTDAPDLLRSCPNIRTLELVLTDPLANPREDVPIFDNLESAAAESDDLLPDLRVLRIVTRHAPGLISSVALLRLVNRLGIAQRPRLTLEFCVPEEAVARSRHRVVEMYACISRTTRVRVVDWVFGPEYDTVVDSQASEDQMAYFEYYNDQYGTHYEGHL